MKKNIIAILFFIFFSVFIFRQYIVFNQVPFPGNLLVSFYQPWASYTWDGYTNGPPSKPMGFDALRIFYPVRSLVTSSLHNGTLPLWNPYSFSGNILLGTYQSAVFHPLTILFLLLPQIDAWSLIIFLSPILASTAMYIFLRDIDLNRKSSVFGALTFAFSGIMVVWWQEMFMSVYSFLPLPLVLFSVRRLFIKKPTIPFLLLIISLTFSIFSGYFQTTFYVFLLMIMWTWYLAITYKKIPPLILVSIASLISLLLSGIQIFSAYEAYTLSPRSTVDVKTMFEIFFIPLKHIITFVAPDYFGNPATHNYYTTSFYHEKALWIGIPAFIFSLFAIVAIQKKDSITKFFTVCAFVFLSLAFSLPTSWFLLYDLDLPFISEMTPSRIVYLSSFCLSVLSAIGIQTYLTRKYTIRLFIVLLLISGLIAVASIPAFEIYNGIQGHSKVPLRNLVIPTGIYLSTSFFILLGNYRRKLLFFSYIGILLISLSSFAYFANKYLYFSKRDYVYPTTPVIEQLKKINNLNRYISIGDAYIERNFSNIFQLYSPEGYEGFNSKRYSELVSAAYNGGKIPEVLTRADVDFRQASNIYDLVNNQHILQILKLLGVRHIVTTHEKALTTEQISNDIQRVWTDNTFDIYEYTNSLPRFFLTTSYVITNDTQQILDTLLDINNTLTTLVLEDNIQKTFEHIDNPGSITITSYKPEYISLEVVANTEALLFVSDNYYPGWIAQIDNKDAPIYRTNYSFRSIIVPEGTHEVTFIYKPKSVINGIVSVGLGILLLIISLTGIQYVRNCKLFLSNK